MRAIWIYLLLLVVSICGCSRDGDVYTAQTGTLSFSGITVDVENNLVSKSEGYAYTVDIVNSSDEVVQSYTSDNVPQKITLNIGTYTVNCYTDTASGAAFDEPIYGDSQSVTIEPGEEASVSLVCKLLSIKLNILFSEKVKDSFTDYSVTVSNDARDNLLFDSTTESNYGYIAADGTLKCIVSMTSVTNGVEETFTATKVYTDLVANDFLTLTYDVEERVDTSEDNSILLWVDETINTTESRYYLVIEPSDLVISGSDFDIDEQQSILSGVSATLEIKVTSDDPITSLLMSQNMSMLVDLGLPKSADLRDSSTATALQEFGVTTTWASDYCSATISLTSLAVKLTPELDTQTISFEATNSTGDITYKRFNYVVIDAVVALIEAEVSDSYFWNDEGLGRMPVTLKGMWYTTDMPDNMTFSYTTDTDVDNTEWTVVTEELTVDEDSKTVSVYLNNTFKLDRTYRYKFTTKDDNGDDDEYGGEMQFTTPWPSVPNMNFDEWYQSSSIWYPNVSSSETYWSTGNEGVDIINKDSNNTPDASFKVSGAYSAKLYSYTGVTLVGLAAGSIFAGDITYSGLFGSTVTIDFGRAYTGRPSRMTGYYCYQTAAITENKESGDTNDYCHIYISLENWGSATTRPSSPTVIGYGELLYSGTMTDFEKFTIDIDYNSTAQPTHIVLVATSSQYGDDYRGGASTLWIDDFNFEFD